MNDIERLIDVSKNCSVLLIEKNPQIQNYLLQLLSGLFRTVVVSSTREDALKRFLDNRFEIVIVSEKLDGLRCIDIIKDIRERDRDVPILLITDFTDRQNLTEAVDLGVTHFINRDSLSVGTLRALSTAIKIVLAEHIDLLKRETEVLKNRERELSIQQKLAFKKQQYVIRDDFYYKKLEYEENGIKETWFINLRYIPFHLLSGDFYSIRKLDRGKILIYLSDAMGKGLSAFMTSSITTSFMNYFVDVSVERGNFDLDEFLMKFIEYSKKHLSEEEALCAIFALLDLSDRKFHVVNFSMPPVLVETCQGQIISINTKNLPIMVFTNQYRKEVIDISNARKILLCSDGFYHTTYMKSIERDFLDSPLRADLYGKFREKVKEIDDDITFLFLKKFDNIPKWHEKFVVEAKLDKITRVSSEIELLLTTKGYDPIFIIELVNALSEVLMNAYEHGCLELDGKSKQRLLKQGLYESYLLELEKNVDRKISIEIGEFEESGERFVIFTVEDEGKGFDTSIIKETVRNIELLHSRGIAMVKGLVDEIYYNDKGNQVTIIKRVKKEEYNNI